MFKYGKYYKKKYVSPTLLREVYQPEGRGQRAELCALIKMYYCQGRTTHPLSQTHTLTHTNTES